MGAMRRAWICAGCGYMIDATLNKDDAAYLLAPEDDRPVLCLPPGRSEADYETMFGWAISELEHQQCGWLGLLRGVIALLGEPGRAAVVAGLILLMDANHDGLIDCAVSILRNAGRG